MTGNFNFVSNSVECLHHPGNLGFQNPSINAVLNNLPNPSDDMIKDQTKFSTYNNSTWTGSLNTITNTSLYLYQANQPNTIKITGSALTAQQVPIQVVAGWNWIGHVVNYPLAVNTALASLPAQPGDIIKGQSAFAQYVSGSVGWVGSLSHLRPLNGYMLKTAMAGTITYPPQINSAEHPTRVANYGRTKTAFWYVDATQYENSMTLIGMFEDHNINSTTTDMELGAFVGDEIRGVAEAVYIEMLDAYIFFMTVYANKSGEPVHFKLFDAATGEVHILKETMTFSTNLHQGSVDDPVPFSLQSTGTSETSDELVFEVQPNPFRNETTCHIVLPFAQDIHLSIGDMNGIEVFSLQTPAQEGLNIISWNGRSNTGAQLSSGVYVVRLKTEQGIMTRKVAIQR